MNASAPNKSKLERIWDNWIEHNIFHKRKDDALLHGFLYIIVPIVVTAISLNSLTPNNWAETGYCFLTILINALGLGYDCFGRWDRDYKHIGNLKLGIMIIPVVIIVIYCFVNLVSILCYKTPIHYNWILCFYFVSVIIAIVDIVCCFAKNIALYDCIKVIQ